MAVCRLWDIDFQKTRSEEARLAGRCTGPQMFALATLISAAEVLVLGGYDDRTQPSA